MYTYEQDSVQYSEQDKCNTKFQYIVYITREIIWMSLYRYYYYYDIRKQVCDRTLLQLVFIVYVMAFCLRGFWLVHEINESNE